MFDESVLTGLDVLDHLQLYGSTVKAADILGLSQSSCSRKYRSLSRSLDLEFDRIDGIYYPRKNADVLCALRQAAQKLRCRRSMLRCSLGWQSPRLELPIGYKEIDIRSMNTAKELSRLQSRLIDVWIGGLLECQSMIPAQLETLQANPLSIGKDLVAIPLVRWKYILVSHRNHPLQKQCGVRSEDLARYPSPAPSLGVAPLLNRALQQHGLANCPYAGSEYEPSRWDDVAIDCHTLTVTPPHRLPELERRLGVIPLPFPLEIQDVLAIVGHRDVISEPCFAKDLQKLRDAIRSSSLGQCSQISWLR